MIEPENENTAVARQCELLALARSSLDFRGRLEAEGIRLSLDGRGRVFANIFIERLWRTGKYEEVYLHS